MPIFNNENPREKEEEEKAPLMFYEKSIIKLVYIKKDRDQRPVERDVGAVVAPPRETAGPRYKRPINTVEK